MSVSLEPEYFQDYIESVNIFNICPGSRDHYFPIIDGILCITLRKKI